jgi:prepilin-type processing-associated H-X9-DG protein
MRFNDSGIQSKITHKASVKTRLRQCMCFQRITVLVFAELTHDLGVFPADVVYTKIWGDVNLLEPHGSRFNIIYVDGLDLRDNYSKV